MQYLEENQWETLSLLKSFRTSPGSLLPATSCTHLSCTILGGTDLKSISKRSKLQKTSNQILDFFSVIHVLDQIATTLGSTFLLKYILLWWWQHLRFSNYSVWRTKDNEEEGTSSPLSLTDTMSITASHDTITHHKVLLLPYSLICQGECKATLKKHFLTNSSIDINNINAQDIVLIRLRVMQAKRSLHLFLR